MLDTRPNLNDEKFEQFTNDILSLSGVTKIYNELNVESGGYINSFDGYYINGKKIYDYSGDSFNISNNNPNNPLIKGDFVSGVVNVNGEITTSGLTLYSNNDFVDYVLTSDGSGKATWQEGNKVIPIGLEGQSLFYEKDNFKNLENSYILQHAVVVENDNELDLATGFTPTFETIFNEWRLFSHNYQESGTSYYLESNLSPPNFPGLDPNASLTPLTQQMYDDGSFWGYDPVNDRIYLTDNFSPYTGFISNQKYDKYELGVTLSSTDVDDDRLNVILGFVTDPETGFEYTLSLHVSYVGAITPLPQYGIVYNFKQNIPDYNTYKSEYEDSAQEVIIDASNLVTRAGNGWSIDGPTRVEIIRNGDVFTIKSSQQGSTIIDESTEIIYDLKDHIKTQKFRGPTQIGFAAQSQKSAYFSDLNFTGFGNYIFYSKNSGDIHDTYEFNQSNNTWDIQNPQTVTLHDYIGKGRLVYTELANKTYYTNGDDTITRLMVSSTGDTAGGTTSLSNLGITATATEINTVADGSTAKNAHTHTSGDLPSTIMYEGENISLLNNNAGYITSYVNNYATGVSGSGNGTLTINRSGLTNITANLAHTHSEYLTSYNNYYATGVSGSGDGTLTISRNGLASISTSLAHSHSEYLTTTGKAADANLLDGLNSTSFLRSDTTDYLTGKLNLRNDIVIEDAYRDHGIFGTYCSSKTQHIWSMGTAYRNAANGSDFGNLYGLAYRHGGVAGSHAVYLVGNGTCNVGMGTNLWARNCVCSPTVCGTTIVRGGTVCGTSVVRTPVSCTTSYFYYSGSGIGFRGPSGCGCAIDWIATSDCRLKKNITPITGALSKIDKFCGVCYDFCTDDTHDMGLIAQDVEKIEPRLVTKGEPDETHKEKFGITDETFGLKYDKFAGLFVEAIKELKNENLILKEAIKELNNKIK